MRLQTALNTRTQPGRGILPSDIVAAHQCNSAQHTSSRVTQADTAGAHYNTKAGRCVHISQHSDGMDHNWPSPKKETENDHCAHILGNRDTLGSAGPRARRTGNTTPQNSALDKAGLCKNQTDAIIGQNHATPHCAQQAQSHQRWCLSLQHPWPKSQRHHRAHDQ